jgi:hypothetical protein
MGSSRYPTRSQIAKLDELPESPPAMHTKLKLQVHDVSEPVNDMAIVTEPAK